MSGKSLRCGCRGGQNAKKRAVILSQAAGAVNAGNINRCPVGRRARAGSAEKAI
ncbi:MAG: hypothetical protein QF577_01955 [Phycisphaerae bacterium]|nr:hypothetical protein [Phycisphaerae bacterium]MDP7636291.1 hypothetical protein [Phycisphaerae bacterium]